MAGADTVGSNPGREATEDEGVNSIDDCMSLESRLCHELEELGREEALLGRKSEAGCGVLDPCRRLANRSARRSVGEVVASSLARCPFCRSALPCRLSGFGCTGGRAFCRVRGCGEWDGGMLEVLAGCGDVDNCRSTEEGFRVGGEVSSLR